MHLGILHSTFNSFETCILKGLCWYFDRIYLVKITAMWIFWKFLTSNNLFLYLFEFKTFYLVEVFFTNRFFPVRCGIWKVRFFCFLISWLMDFAFSNWIVCLSPLTFLASGNIVPSGPLILAIVSDVILFHLCCGFYTTVITSHT